MEINWNNTQLALCNALAELLTLHTPPPTSKPPHHTNRQNSFSRSPSRDRGGIKTMGAQRQRASNSPRHFFCGSIPQPPFQKKTTPKVQWPPDSAGPPRDIALAVLVSAEGEPR